ncbi:uncharacterized protein LOC144168253, partial [Haemaphysalis longicornis]
TEEEYTAKEKVLQELWYLAKENGYKIKGRRTVSVAALRATAVLTRDKALAAHSVITKTPCEEDYRVSVYIHYDKISSCNIGCITMQFWDTSFTYRLIAYADYGTSDADFDDSQSALWLLEHISSGRAPPSEEVPEESPSVTSSGNGWFADTNCSARTSTSTKDSAGVTVTPAPTPSTRRGNPVGRELQQASQHHLSFTHTNTCSFSQ